MLSAISPLVAALALVHPHRAPVQAVRALPLPMHRIHCTPAMMASSDEAKQREEQKKDGPNFAPSKTSGRRIGGAVPPSQASSSDDGDERSIPDTLLAVVPIAFLLLAVNSLGGMMSQPRQSFSYSISTYSESVVRTDDGTGQPRFETRRDSSFSTNIPGLAERLAQENAANQRLFPDR